MGSASDQPTGERGALMCCVARWVAGRGACVLPSSCSAFMKFNGRNMGRNCRRVCSSIAQSTPVVDFVVYVGVAYLHHHNHRPSALRNEHTLPWTCTGTTGRGHHGGAFLSNVHPLHGAAECSERNSRRGFGSDSGGEHGIVPSSGTTFVLERCHLRAAVRRGRRCWPGYGGGCRRPSSRRARPWLARLCAP